MKQKIYVLCIVISAIMMVGCTGGDTNNEAQVGDFDQTMHVADSLYNSMEFRNAYDLYLQLLDNKEAKADDEKMLNVLNSLCMASELAGHKADQTKWMQQLLDLAKQTGNAYYESMGLMSMGKRIYYEGDRQQGVKYVNEAIDMMSKTGREDADHLNHGLMIILAGLYNEMNDLNNALKVDERNVQLTMKGTRWGTTPQLQLIDRRMALAKMAYCLAKMGNFHRADSAYAAWQAIQYEGDHTRDYFIADYLRERGRYQEAVKVNDDLIQIIRAHGDTLGEMMNCAKWGLAEIYQKMGNYKQAADLYVQVLEINDTLKARQAKNTAQELAAAYHDQEQKQTIMEQEIVNTRQQYILLLVLTILLGVIVYTFIVIRQKRIVNEKNHGLVNLIDEAVKYKERAQKLQSLLHRSSADRPTAESIKLKVLPDEELFQHLCDDIRENQLYLDPKFDRQAVCDRYNLTAVQVGRAFAQGSDYASVSDFIRDCRLDHARILLKSSDMKIAEVAAASGFSLPTTFNHDFKARFNLSPTEYRKQ